MNYITLKKHLEFFCTQELHLQQIANSLATSGKHDLWLSCINHQFDCVNLHEPLIALAEQICTPHETEQLYRISVHHTQKIIKNQK